MPLVSDVCDRARKVYLNDAGSQLYSNLALLPFIQQAYGEMQLELTANGLEITKETSAVLAVAAGIEPVIDVNLIPDLVMPLDIYERGVGETYFPIYPMTKLDWEPNTERTDTLRYWNWRENQIKFIGSTSAREVKVRYIKGLPALIGESTPLAILNAVEFLAARSAGLASRFIGGNFTRADACDTDAGRLLPRLVAIEVKSNQTIAYRRRPFRFKHHVG